MRTLISCAVGALLLLIPALSRGQSPEPDRAHAVACLGGAADVKCPESFAFQRSGPLTFLAFLRTAPSPFSVWGLHKGWLRPSDVAPLLALVGSEEPCAFVVMSAASYIPPGRSTVGQEALFLLDGIRQGQYPPTLHSHAYDQKSRNKLLRWARQQPR
jgi:hypothetical protein